MKIQDLSKDGTELEISKSGIFNAALLEMYDYKGQLVSTYLGKAEVQQLIDELEQLKKEIL